MAVSRPNGAMASGAVENVLFLADTYKVLSGLFYLADYSSRYCGAADAVEAKLCAAKPHK